MWMWNFLFYTWVFLPNALQMSSGWRTFGFSIQLIKNLSTWAESKSGMMTMTSSPTGIWARMFLMKGLSPARTILWEDTRPPPHLTLTLLTRWHLWSNVSILSNCPWECCGIQVIVLSISVTQHFLKIKCLNRRVRVRRAAYEGMKTFNLYMCILCYNKGTNNKFAFKQLKENTFSTIE